MKKQLVICGITLVLIVGIFSGCFEPQTTEYFDGEYQADEKTVVLVTTFNGDIEISTWDGETVTMDGVKKSTFGQEELDNVEINVVESEDKIEIEAEYVGSRLTTPSVDMNIKVPAYATVESATTSNGDIQINDTKGDVTATTSNGDIVIQNIDGYVTATTSNGFIDVTGTTGVKNLESSNGRIETEVYDYQENISIITSNGGITVYLNPDLNATIDMETSNGDISVINLALNLTTDEEKHKIGTLNNPGNTLTIDTSNGNINLNKLDMQESDNK